MRVLYEILKYTEIILLMETVHKANPQLKIYDVRTLTLAWSRRTNPLLWYEKIKKHTL